MNKTNENVGYVGPQDCWKILGVAIVKQAVSDWKEATRLQRNQSTDNIKAKELLKSAESFLRSEDVEFYSGCSGRTLLRKLRAGEI